MQMYTQNFAILYVHALFLPILLIKKKGSCKSLEASSIIPPSLKILWNFIQIYSFLLLPCYFKWGHLGIPSVEVIVGQTPKWNKTTSHPIVWAKSTPGWKNSKWKGPKSGKNCLQEIPISLVPLQSNEWKRKSRKRERCPCYAVNVIFIIKLKIMQKNYRPIQL